MSGSVNPDSLLFAVAAAVFYCLARAFRRGLTLRLAIALGIGIAVGFLTKLNFVGFAFGVYVGLAVLAIREARAHGRRTLRAPLLAALIGALPVALYALRNVLQSHHTLGLASSGGSLLAPGELLHLISYIWQLYLPRLPGMTHYFEGLATYKDIWFDRSVGLYGWMDTMFPTWVDTVALIPAVLVVAMFLREVVVRREALRRRLPELGVYAAIAAGLLVLIGGSSYDSDALNHSPAFAEPRYLLPLLPLLGAVFALAVRGAGRRWAPAAGAALIVLIFGFDVVSQLQVIARYYG
jgi:4-amino-4-deoxy-L-arabinose transferase-like glycosyltransferase